MRELQREAFEKRCGTCIKQRGQQSAPNGQNLIRRLCILCARGGKIKSGKIRRVAKDLGIDARQLSLEGAHRRAVRHAAKGVGADQRAQPLRDRFERLPVKKNQSAPVVFREDVKAGVYAELRKNQRFYAGIAV